jgi:hypothetical protein
LGTSLKNAIDAVNKAVRRYWSAKPPQILKGLEKLGKGLFKDLKKPLAGHFNEAEMKLFEGKFMSFFGQKAADLDGVTDNIKRFEKTAEPHLCVEAVENVLEELIIGIEGMVPEKTALEINKFMDSFIETLDALSEGWSDYLETKKEDEQKQAVKYMDKNLKKAMDTVIPKKAKLIELGVWTESWKKEDAYETVLGTIDGCLQSLTKDIMDFQKQMVEGAVCYHHSFEPKSAAPDVCPAGCFTWDGATSCWPRCSSSLLQSGSATSLVNVESDFTDSESELMDDFGMGVDDAVRRKIKPKGTKPANCKTSHPYRHGTRCYENCPASYKRDGKLCKTDCSTMKRYGHSRGTMCGGSARVLKEAEQRMVKAVFTGILDAFSLITDMVKDGVSADSLTKTIKVFVDMAKPFMYPRCDKAMGR